ncbi:hypothetical protein DNL40_11790 [Xylanimonas oleitrophica]|uniref:Uncharacterized protein n=1 Tax=Xylanimonas oleitrophica TaxID=2607479 RepID=A0A2W5WPD5_9MICO|nr:hypothetical protein DNL40_11790 [Xylanimonas oleitrophica]
MSVAAGVKAARRRGATRVSVLATALPPATVASVATVSGATIVPARLATVVTGRRVRVTARALGVVVSAVTRARAPVVRVVSVARIVLAGVVRVVSVARIVVTVVTGRRVSGTARVPSVVVSAVTSAVPVTAVAASAGRTAEASAEGPPSAATTRVPVVRVGFVVTSGGDRVVARTRTHGVRSGLSASTVRGCRSRRSPRTSRSGSSTRRHVSVYGG